MTIPPDIHERFDRIAVDMKARDEALRRAFEILTDGLLRMQAVIDDIHAAATMPHPSSQVPALLAEVKEMLKAQPEQIAQAVGAVLHR